MWLLKRKLHLVVHAMGRVPLLYLVNVKLVEPSMDRVLRAVRNALDDDGFVHHLTLTQHESKISGRVFVPDPFEAALVKVRFDESPRLPSSKAGVAVAVRRDYGSRVAASYVEALLNAVVDGTEKPNRDAALTSMRPPPLPAAVLAGLTPVAEADRVVSSLVMLNMVTTPYDDAMQRGCAAVGAWLAGAADSAVPTGILRPLVHTLWTVAATDDRYSQYTRCLAAFAGYVAVCACSALHANNAAATLELLLMGHVFEYHKLLCWELAGQSADTAVFTPYQKSSQAVVDRVAVATYWLLSVSLLLERAPKASVVDLKGFAEVVACMQDTDFCACLTAAIEQATACLKTRL